MNKFFALSMVCGFYVSSGAIASAEPAAAASDAGVDNSALSDIVVTARRVSENLQMVPVSVTAFGPEQLAERGIVNIVDVAMTTPNMHLAPAIGSQNTASISLRGQYQRENLLTVDPSVGVYVNEVYFARDYSTLSDLLDVSGVEILKGPQGTLYGRNTTGGAVKITTVAPDSNAGYTGFADATYGNYNAFSFMGAVNIPIIPGILAVRYAGSFHSHDGYTSSWLVPINLTTGASTSLTPIGRIPTDNENRYTQRLSALFTPNNSVSLSVVGSLFRANEHGPFNISPYGDIQSYTFGNATPSVFSNSPQRANFYGGLTDWTPSSLTDTKSVTSTLEWVISDHVTAKAIVGLVDASNMDTTNSDGTVGSGLSFIQVSVLEDQEARQTSEEFQLLGNEFDKRLTWIAGLYNFDEKGHEDSDDGSLNYSQRTYVFNKNVALASAFDAHNKSKSAFADVSFGITEKLRVNGGLRYTEDTKGIDSHQRYVLSKVCILQATDASGAPIPGIITSTNPNGPCSFTNTLKSGYPLFDVGADYQFTPDLFAYVKINDGVRSGGQQGRIPVGVFPAPFAPEKLVNYEVGVKSEFLDRRLRVNLSLFDDFYKNIQETLLISLADGSVASTEANKGNARIKGLELESIARLTNQFTLSGGIGLTNLKFELPDTVQPNTPKFTANLSPEFTQPTSFGDLALRLDYMYTGPVYYDTNAILPQNNLPGYSLLNGRLLLKMVNKVEVSLFGKNLTGKEYYNQEYQAAYTPGLFWGVRQAYVGPPRTYGVEANYKF